MILFLAKEVPGADAERPAARGDYRPSGLLRRVQRLVNVADREYQGRGVGVLDFVWGLYPVDPGNSTNSRSKPVAGILDTMPRNYEPRMSEGVRGWIQARCCCTLNQ
jgi:hypothetical protein